MNDDFLTQWRKSPPADFADELYERLSRLESSQEEEHMAFAHDLPATRLSPNGATLRPLRFPGRLVENYSTLAAAVIALIAVGVVAIILNQPMLDSSPVEPEPGIPNALASADATGNEAADSSAFDGEVKTDSFQEEIGEATSAHVSITSNFENVTIGALPAGSENLIEAEVEYVGEMHFDVSGSSTKTVVLREDRIPNN